MDIQSKQMTKEVEDWINEVISKPNKIFGNLPPCPYARKAWKDKKVKVTYDKSVLMEDYAKLNSGELDLIMIIQQDANVDELYELKDYLESNLGKDYVILEDHPELKEEVGGMNLNFGKPVLFVQNRKKLTEARKFLETKDYYKNFDKEYKDDILSN
mgnify:FL=1|tara:strand:+ start:5539 stop:6009 length:471 start_codon:yes stop_codon:yes gene_type:complete